MVFPDISYIEKRIFNNGRLVLPGSIRSGIEKCLVSTPPQIDSAKEYLSTAYNLKGYSERPDVRYESDATIDAYTIDYLPRNFFIPRIVIRDLALCKKAVNFGNTIRVLDIGSGTGAVSLGIFDLFSKAPLNKYYINLMAIDSCLEALKRQTVLRRESGLRYEGDRLRCKRIDLKEVSKIKKFLQQHDPWDLIISANCMVELEDNNQQALIELLSDHLSKSGSIVIAEPAQDRAKQMLLHLSEIAHGIGLSVYYPCNKGSGCPNSKCWTWRDYKIEDIEPIKKNNTWISFSNKQLLISMIILNKHGATILDPFRSAQPDLKWDLIRPRKKNSGNYEICGTSHIFNDTSARYKRGSIVGWKKSGSSITIKEYTEL